MCNSSRAMLDELYTTYPEFLSIRQAQEILGCGRALVFKILRVNRIPHISLGPYRYIVAKHFIIDYLEGSLQNTPVPQRESQELYAHIFGKYPEMLSIHQLQGILGVGRDLIHQTVRENKIPHLKIGERKVRIPKRYVVDFLVVNEIAGK